MFFFHNRGDRTFYGISHNFFLFFSKKKKIWNFPNLGLDLKLNHFLSTFCKKCIFTIKNPKNLLKFSKMIKLLLGKQILAFADARFDCKLCTDSCDMPNFGRNARNFHLDMVFHISMCLWSKWRKFHFLLFVFLTLF